MPALVFFVLAISCGSAPRAKASVYGGLGLPSDPVPFMAAVRTGVLPGGLKYYILENSMPENRAYLTLAVNAGSILETDEEQGLAHFVEHMAFNGTARFPEAELVNYLRSLGMRFGPEVNAYTSYDRTVYGIEVPVETGADGRKRIPPTALAVIDDWTHAISFTPADVDDERPVIMEEYRARLGVEERIFRKTREVIFRGSPYADRLPIGLPEIIETAPAERLMNFYKTWYRADNMALIFVGDFDGAALEAELASHFSIPAPETPLDRPYYDLPEPEKGRREVEIITDPELPYTLIYLYYRRFPQALGGDLASYRQGLIDTLIQRMLAIRFEDAAAREETPYVQAASFYDRFGKNSRLYGMMGIAKPGLAEASLRALLREKESISRYGFTKTEIARAKGTLISDLEQMVSEKDRQPSNSYVDELADHFLAGLGLADVEWELDAVSRMLPDIGSRDISAAIKDYFAADDLTVFLIAPESEQASLPPADQVRRIEAESRRARIPRPRNAALDATLIDKEPLPGSIVSESRDPLTGAVYWELSNGARVILKETKNKNNEIVLYGLAKGGSTSAGQEELISTALAAEMINASGVGPYSRRDLIKKISDKQVSISMWVSSFLRGFNGSTTIGDQKTLFELLYLGFTQPRIDPETVNVLLDQYRTTLAQHGENPEAVFSDEVERTAFGNNPYFLPMELADLAKVNRDQALAFITRALNPADYTFVFTGNPDIPVLRSHVETYLASIPRGPQSWNDWTDPHIVRPGKIEKKVYKGKEEKSLVYLGWYIPAEFSEFGGAAASVLSEYLDIRLTEEIRESLGGVYSVSVNVSLGLLPSGGELSMGVFFICDPNRVEVLAAAIADQLKLVAGGTIDGDVFTKSVEALKKNHEESIQSNAYISRIWAMYTVIFDLSLDRLDKRPELYETIGIADIQQTAADLLSTGPMMVTLYPEGWGR
ncbi:MAG: insulinase family protein [Treponema sp.]|nr:insulinase family protein [Treponema sp.]